MRHDQNSNFSCSLAWLWLYMCVAVGCRSLLFSSCAAQGCRWMGGDIISAGVQFPVEVRVHAHVSSCPLRVCSFFPKILSCLFEHSLSCRVLHEKYAGGPFLSRSASVSGDGYGAICLLGCATACKLGTIESMGACNSLCVARSLDGRCVFSWKPLDISPKVC